MKKDKKLIVLITTVLLLVVLDQCLKKYSCMYSNNIINENELEQNNVLSTIITNVIVLGIIIKFFANQRDRINMNLVVIIAFLLAGGVSNLIDKIATGRVINYIKIYNLPAINLGFIFIVIGWIGLAGIFAWNTYKEYKEKKETQNK